MHNTQEWGPRVTGTRTHCCGHAEQDSHFGKLWQFLLKLHTHTSIWPSYPTSRYLCKCNDNIRSQEKPALNVYCSFIHNHQNLRTTQISLNWGMNEKQNETVTHPCNGQLFWNKREQPTELHNSPGESQMLYAKWKKPDSKSMGPSVWHSGKGETIGTENRSVVAKG